MNRDAKAEAWAALRFEASELFTPSVPIGAAELFAGRTPQIGKLLDSIAERGRHAIVYGEPGVGKTSLAQILRFIIPTKTRTVKFIRQPAFSKDTFFTIWQRIFRDIYFTMDLGEGEREYNLAQAYSESIAPGDIVREMRACFNDNDIPVIILDEYNKIADPNVSHDMAETVKALSDEGINVTIIVVGVSDSVVDLVKGHESIIRCSEEVLMPRMNKTELKEIIEKRVFKLGMKIEGNAKWKIINLSNGLPAFTHSLGKESVLRAIDTRRLTVREVDVDFAIGVLLGSSQGTLKNDYEVATRSNQERARYKQILTACAMAKSDENGYFVPKEVQAPLKAILDKPVGIDGFNRNLREFTEPKRGSVLQDKGSERLYRYRFKNPAMQPYVIMKGIQDGYLDETAKLALSFPEQSDLFPSG